MLKMQNSIHVYRRQITPEINGCVGREAIDASQGGPVKCHGISADYFPGFVLLYIANNIDIRCLQILKDRAKKIPISLFSLGKEK